MDPLLLLRDATIGKRLDTVVLDEDRVHFGDRFSFAGKRTTSYKSKQGTADYYELATVVFFAKNIHLSTGEYFRAAQAARIGPVTAVDRKDLTNWLTGITSSSEFIKVAVAEDLAPAHDAADDAAPAAKRARVDGSASAGRAPLGLQG